MTTKQQQMYERAMQSVRRDVVTVVGHGTRKSDGAAVYCMPSRTAPGTWHIIVVNGLELTCDCSAAQQGRYCAHRAAVWARLEIEAQVRRDTLERATLSSCSMRPHAS